MDQFANKAEEDKRAFFELASDRKGLTEQIIEKDFWVCWTLKKLFSLPTIKDHLIFKGGTSLSKAYGLIERFSEDIDISIDKMYLGFTGELDPEMAPSHKKQQLLIKMLSKACSEFVQNELKVKLQKAFQKSLSGVDANWHIVIDPNDVDGQSLLFHYPTSKTDHANSYVSRAVKIELGSRGGREPTEITTITPFVEELIPNTLLDPKAQIKTLAAERTFWEKATILHMYSHWPELKRLPERQSRHFFDFYKLLQSDVRHSAIANLDLLNTVSRHKKIYFRAGWANYDNAIQGRLSLVPPEQVLHLLKNDYERMQDMFYGEPIAWDVILNEIEVFQHEFNAI